MATRQPERALRRALYGVGWTALGLLLSGFVLADGLGAHPHGGGELFLIAVALMFASIATTLVGAALLIRLKLLGVPGLLVPGLLLTSPPLLAILRMILG